MERIQSRSRSTTNLVDVFAVTNAGWAAGQCNIEIPGIDLQFPHANVKIRNSDQAGAGLDLQGKGPSFLPL